MRANGPTGLDLPVQHHSVRLRSANVRQPEKRRPSAAESHAPKLATRGVGGGPGQTSHAMSHTRRFSAFNPRAGPA
jgi:hypothetical protein